MIPFSWRAIRPAWLPARAPLAGQSGQHRGRDWGGLVGVVLADVLLHQLAADPDLVQRAVVVDDVAGVDRLRTLPVLLGTLHFQDPDLQPSIGQHGANAGHGPVA